MTTVIFLPANAYRPPTPADRPCFDQHWSVETGFIHCNRRITHGGRHAKIEWGTGRVRAVWGDDIYAEKRWAGHVRRGGRRGAVTC